MLFRECHLNCVDYDTFLAENQKETTCVKNCQAKVSTAFDLMLAVKMRLAANKTTENVIDISEYTEMEIEHGHDTASLIKHRYGVHTRVDDIEQFRDKY